MIARYAGYIRSSQQCHGIIHFLSEYRDSALNASFPAG